MCDKNNYLPEINYGDRHSVYFVADVIYKIFTNVYGGVTSDCTVMHVQYSNGVTI